MMALETERCSPQNASSPGPNEVTQNPGTNGGSNSSGYASPVVAEATIHPKSKSAFHQIALLSQKINGASIDRLDERPSPVEYYSAAVTPTSLTTSTPPSTFCSPLSTTGCANLSNDSSSSSPELTSAKEIPLAQLSMLQPPPVADLVTPTLPPSYSCHKFTPEMYIAQIQNFHAAAAGGLPFNPFVFPTARLPALKMQLYNGGVAPALNMTANDYMLGLHNAKLMCEMLQMQQQQHSGVVFERGRSKPNDEPSPEEAPSHSPSARVGSGAFTPPVTAAASDLYSRPDSPCSSVNSNKCYKQCSCSPSSMKCAPSRSPSPVALCQAASQAASPPRPLPFSVDNILRPEFGKSLHSMTATSNGGSHHAKLAATVAAVGKRRRASSPLQQLLLPRSKHPKYERTSMDDGASVASTKDSMSPRPTTDNEESADRLTDDSSSTCDKDSDKPWPAWVYCTRYSDRPSSGPRSRRMKRKEKKPEEKRPRTAFSGDQLSRLKKEFDANNYLNEKRRQELANELGLHEAQIKIWFQNKRAKMKKQSGVKNPLALQLMAQGLYNHTTVAMSDEEMEDYSPGTGANPTSQTSSPIIAQ